MRSEAIRWTVFVVFSLAMGFAGVQTARLSFATTSPILPLVGGVLMGLGVVGMYFFAPKALVAFSFRHTFGFWATGVIYPSEQARVYDELVVRADDFSLWANTEEMTLAELRKQFDRLSRSDLRKVQNAEGIKSLASIRKELRRSKKRFWAAHALAKTHGFCVSLHATYTAK